MRSPLPVLGFALASTISLAAPRLAHADETPPPTPNPYVELGIFGGAHFFSSTSAVGRDINITPPFVSLATTGLIGLRLGYAITPAFMIEGDFTIIPTKLKTGSQNIAVIGAGADVLYHIFTGRVRPFLTAGGGVLVARPDNSLPLIANTVGHFRGGLGVKIDFTQNIGLRIDGRILAMPDVRPRFITENWEVQAGFYGRFELGPKAPPPPADKDGDGLLDPEDRCPTEAGPKENGGCPDKDGDGDGVVDRLDKCPTEAGPQDNQGCPRPKDTDGDGLLDGDDRCPTEAGPKENGGCPDKDADGDGIVDRLDKCPEQPETRNGFQDEDGCPDELPVAVKKFTGAIQGINFLPNKAELTPASAPVLKQAAQVLKEYPEVRLAIAGHTDNIGKPEVNKTLSQDRAEAVRKALIAEGVAAERLEAQGFGQEKPVAPNTTAAGRAKNRRVEFSLIQAGGAAPAAASAPAPAVAPAATPAPAAPTRPIAR